VLLAPFTSIADMARLHYPALRMLLPYTRNKYDTLAAIRTMRAPLLIVHGDADSIVPAEQGRRLFEAANEPKRLLIVPSAGHNDVVVQGGRELWQALRDVLNSSGAAPL
jgi:fermentation-respiration switch protein FrsA (DUF1100 family)